MLIPFNRCIKYKEGLVQQILCNMVQEYCSIHPKYPMSLRQRLVSTCSTYNLPVLAAQTVMRYVLVFYVVCYACIVPGSMCGEDVIGQYLWIFLPNLKLVKPDDQLGAN